MGALDKLMRKPTAKLTHIEYAIKQSYAYGSKTIAEPAADDLANIDAELAALRERVKRLEASNARLFDDLHNQIHQTVGAEMERDELREQVADVNELLWEFSENPNIELGEKGHNKIEDYFKKISSG